MRGQFMRDVEGIDLMNNWKWLSRGHLKGNIGVLISGAHEQTLRTNYVKFKIDQTIE